MQEQPLEFSAASDFLYENGFYDASAALRILYPKLPQSMLNKAYIFRELTKESVDYTHIDRFKLVLSVDALNEDNSLVGQYYRCNIDRIDFYEEEEVDSNTLIVRCTGVFSSITRLIYLKTLSLVTDNKVLLTKPTDTSMNAVPGDSINLTYTLEMPDYMLPSEVVSNFKPGHSIRRVGV